MGLLEIGLRVKEIRRGTADGVIAALACRMALPHGVFAVADGSVFVRDSESHRVWVLRRRKAV
ncbi:MAG: hypothetical protein O3C21_08915 [Verrucomicrobia bacterium]|nr:hypothetical protein [Verrucomicrobiota bacterium]